MTQSGLNRYGYVVNYQEVNNYSLKIIFIKLSENYPAMKKGRRKR